MSHEFRELPPEEPCPCNSGFSYGDCCGKKDLNFGYQDGHLTKQVHLTSQAADILKETDRIFEMMYGRKPDSNDYVFTFAPIEQDKMLFEGMRLLRESGIPEDVIYAYYKTDGLLVTEDNEHLISDTDIEEFEFFRSEYEEQINAGPEDDSANILQYVAAMNFCLEDRNLHAFTTLHMAYHDFIKRHSTSPSFLDFEPNTPIEYGMFSAIKTCKTLESVQKLSEMGLTESIYALGRSIFENYLYMNAINSDPGFFEEKLLPKMDRGNYRFAKKPNGAVDYRRLVHLETGREHNVDIQIAGLRQYCSLQDDLEIYNLFYRTACRHVHVDALSARSYFESYDPYDEIDPALTAALITYVLCAMLLRRLSLLDGVSESFRKDILYFLKHLYEDLGQVLEAANSDLEHKNDVLDVLRHRLNSEQFD